MKKFITVIAIIICMLSIMFAEYRFIMINLCPYIGEDSTVYIEIFDQIDEYYADPISELYGD